ncbi:RNA-directed DNA polymerase, eukaryota [Tanacetum coccineum]
MASRHGNSPKNLNANHTAVGAIGFRAVATRQRDDAERYMRGYEAYEQFLAMSNQEAGGSGSGSGIKRMRAYIPREREEAEQRLLDDYFGDDETPPKYPEENFRRMYHMSSTLFAQIVNDITSYDAQPLPEYFRFFRKGYDATGRASIGPILKCTSVIRQLAYGTASDAFDEYLQIAERCSRECLDKFTKCIYILYVEEYLRRPSLEDIEKTYACTKKNIDSRECPGVLIKESRIKNYGFGMHILGFRGANNDLNVLYGSPPLFDDVLSDTAPEAPFVVNGRTYKKGYYFADGIYPTWSSFVKTFSIARDEKTSRFKRVQESARKDIERAFGVLQADSLLDKGVDVLDRLRFPLLDFEVVGGDKQQCCHHTRLWIVARAISVLIEQMEPRELSGEEVWEAIENFAQGQKEWDNPPNIISEQEVANLKTQAKRLFGNEDVWVEMHRGITWDKVENLGPQSTSTSPHHHLRNTTRP